MLILAVPYGAIGICVLVQFALTKHGFDLRYIRVDGFLLACHVYVVDVFGSEKVGPYLKFWVEARWLQSNVARGVSQLE